MKQAATLMKVAILTSIVVGGSAFFPTSALAGPDCTCRYSGGEVQQGDTACIRTPKGMAMARCEMVLNNTSWKMLDVPCPSAAAEPLSPTFNETGKVVDTAQSKRVLTRADLLEPSKG